jgi:hypothetical protein
MTKISYASMLSALIASAYCVGSASAQNVRWKPEGIAANGTGCQLGENTALILAGDQMQIIFWNMGIYLPANSGLPLAQRKACTVALGAEISGGYYAKGIKQSLRYGGIKSANASAAIAGQSTFFGLPLKPLTVNLENGTPFNEVSAVVESEDGFLASDPSPAMWCLAGFNPSGLLTARVVTQGSRDSDAEDLLLSSHLYDLKYTATMLWDKCPM